MTVRSYQVPPPEGKNGVPGRSGVSGGAHSRVTGATSWGQDSARPRSTLAVGRESPEDRA